MNWVMEIEGLSKNYKNFSLTDINLKIPYGHIVGLIGENGAGKTTLISLILNQIKRSNGSIKILGKDNLQKEKEIKEDIGFVMDECCFHNCLSPNNIQKIMQKIYRNWDSSQYTQLLKNFQIVNTKKISEMSKGMKSKLMLAVAMSHHPKFLILDEITSGLDPVIRDDILMFLKDFVMNGENAVFFSTHITSDLDKVADDIAFLNNGQLVFYENIKKLKNEYALLQCNQKELLSVDPNDMIAHYAVNDQAIALIHNYVRKEFYPGTITSPTIDDIMLLYIKGGCI